MVWDKQNVLFGQFIQNFGFIIILYKLRNIGNQKIVTQIFT